MLYQEECNTSGIANFGICCLGHIGFHTLPYLPQKLGQILNTNEIHLPSNYLFAFSRIPVSRFNNSTF